MGCPISSRLFSYASNCGSLDFVCLFAGATNCHLFPSLSTCIVGETKNNLPSALFCVADTANNGREEESHSVVYAMNIGRPFLSKDSPCGRNFSSPPDTIQFAFATKTGWWSRK